MSNTDACKDCGASLHYPLCGICANARKVQSLREALDENKRLREVVGRIEEWTHKFGSALVPSGPDTYGDGVRACKAQVQALLAVEPRPATPSGNQRENQEKEQR